MMKLTRAVLCLVVLSSALPIRADDARFDLPGPRIDVYVTRGNATLPIAQVPELQPNDKLRVKTDLPATQSNHLLLIVAFLRGTTNEPPDNWFTKIETWKQSSPEGTLIVVPDGAQRAMLFVAPETGGDFNTLRSAVKGNPGLFTRASISLNKASLEQQRIERYITNMQTVALDDEKVIQMRSAKLAAALALKPNADCFKQPVADQVDCLTQTSAPLLLDDGHGQTVADAISTGASSDFFNEAAQSDDATYSAYVGTLIDLVHLVVMMRTAQYQYIPAISFPRGPTLNLKLNAPPSFNKTKSVIVVALPPIQSPRLPTLRPATSTQVFCLANPALMLPLRGEPLLFSTSFAHDLSVEFDASASMAGMPLTPDAFDGGLVRSDTDLARGLQATAGSGPSQAASTVRGTLRGYWGFRAFEGPILTFQRSDDGNWQLTDTNALVAGKDGQVTLQGSDTACISHIVLTSADGCSIPVAFAPVPSGADAMSLKIPLQGKQPGTYSLVVQQYGNAIQKTLPLTAYSADTRLDKVLISLTGDTATIFGKGLENVLSMKVGDQVFSPATQAEDLGSLDLHASHTGFFPKIANAVVTLKDGRVINMRATSENPSATLQLVSLQPMVTPRDGELEVTLGSREDIPLRAVLNFVVQSAGVFPLSQSIEVATADGTLRTTLSFRSESLILQDAHTVVGSVDLYKAFGESAFGELHLRAVQGDGTAGSWITLGKLVRLPHIKDVHCTEFDAPTCVIEGRDLFLSLAFSPTETFESEALVPTGFDEPTFVMSMPASGRWTTLYMRLRDDPQATATVRVPPRDARQ
ncbi:hypothetical protein [Granulicella sp. L46]|uniref:hypothetical protein n=1 Tax=Granulicella sp. L46 TaxID=1641865 RepID=UPI00131A9656|nr:hypothetical protein [Granulicella sp. L46]